MLENGQTVTINASPKLIEILNDCCKENNFTISELMTKALENYVAEYYEDKEDYEMAMDSLREYRENGEAGVSAEEVFANAGL